MSKALGKDLEEVVENEELEVEWKSMKNARINMSVLDYRIESDPNQLIVKLVKRDADGNIRMVHNKKAKMAYEDAYVVGYFGNMTKALQAIQRDYLYRDGLGKKEIKTIADYINEMTYITKEFEDKLDLGEGFK